MLQKGTNKLFFYLSEQVLQQVRVADVFRLQVQDADRRRAHVLRLLQPKGPDILQAVAGAMPGAQQGPAGRGRGVRVPHPEAGLRQAHRVLPLVPEEVSATLLLGEAETGGD